MSSDNPSGAGNQQERLSRMLNLKQIPDPIGYYFAGFVDGEGSFNLSFRRRPDYTLPWKVSLCFNVSQKDQAILTLLKRYLKCGEIRPKENGVWMYEVSSLGAIRENIIPFFERFSFLSAKKKRDFAIFRIMVEEMSQGAHLSREGIIGLLSLRRSMNDGGKRKYSEDQILRAFDATESSETIRRTSSVEGEDEIVRTAWRHAEAGRNDRPASPE